MKNKRFFCVSLVFVCILCVFCGIFSGCSTTDFFSCPYVIANPRVELGKLGETHEFAGAYFTLFNDSEKTISKYTVSFLLYDDEGNNPFIGSNCVVEKIAAETLPHESKDFVISLDSYLSTVPDEPYEIDFIYLREILYSDGSVWSDPFGMYAIKEVYE